MNSPLIPLLPTDVLLELLPAAFDPLGASSWYPSRPPTDASVRRINEELHVQIPTLFIEIAQAFPAYGGWFGSIGDDFDSHNHLTQINRRFREEGLSTQYVLLNHGHDGHCHAWDTQAPRSESGELPIVSFDYNCDDRPVQFLELLAATFAQYIDMFVRAHAPRCPEKSLRRRAKRLLAGYEISMNVDSPAEQLRQNAARVGIQLADSTEPVPEIECCGHILPAPFVWFCANYPNHAGFPHGDCEPPFGLLSPFGPKSPLQLRNAEIRRNNANWPAHWVSFWHGSDGDFCFSFDRDGHPWIVYWYYNVDHADFREDTQAIDFAEWFSQQVECVIKQKTT